MVQNKTISLEVENKQLDALEALLTADLSAIEKDKAKKLVLKLWHSLVFAYDSENNDLENVSTISPLALYNALGVVMKYDESFYSPKEKELKVQNIYEDNEVIKLIPENVIAIITRPDFKDTDKEKVRSRRKMFFIKEETKKGVILKTYFTNNDIYSFNYLVKYIDPLNYYLLNVSKNAIVNVDCYELSKKNLLKLNIDELKAEQINIINFSDDTLYNTKINFPVIKNGIKKRLYLQKFMIGYKNDFKL
ncbi:MAG: hypothetical protein K8R85_05325 [Bacteroidetes bacterium]|nr:hypothetical protein [Bacteroidota bacterium]